MTPAERYGSGYQTGACDEHAGIAEPEAGYPDDELWLRGMKQGRADYRQRVAALAETEDACRSTITPRW